MHKIDYTDQASNRTRFFDREIFSSYTPYGIKCLDSAFCDRIMYRTYKLKGVYDIQREVIGCYRYEETYKEISLVELNTRKGFCYGLRVVWETPYGTEITRDYFYSVFPKFNELTRQESKRQIKRDIINNPHLHQDIKNNLIYNLKHYNG